jgi:hypothetical protein
MKGMTCDKNLQYTAVFDVTNAYKGAPQERTLNEGPDSYCGNVRVTCCKSQNGLFKNLNHYWENINSSENFSTDLSKWSNMLYRISSVYSEIWQTRGKVVLKASIPESLKKKINFLLATNMRYTKRDVDFTKKCFENIKSMMHGAMCAMCSPETY